MDWIGLGHLDHDPQVTSQAGVRDGPSPGVRPQKAGGVSGTFSLPRTFLSLGPLGSEPGGPAAFLVSPRRRTLGSTGRQHLRPLSGAEQPQQGHYEHTKAAVLPLVHSSLSTYYVLCTQENWGCIRTGAQPPEKTLKDRGDLSLEEITDPSLRNNSLGSTARQSPCPRYRA